LALKTEEYVEAARALGCSHVRIAGRHIFPNMVPPLLIQSSLTVAAAVIAEASLSFLGLGQQPPAPSWGSMLNAAQRYLSQAPWIALYPGLVIFFLVMALNVLGDAVPLTIMRPRLEAALSDVYDGRGFVVLRGLPVGRWSDDDTGLVFWGLGRYLGSPLSQNPQGELLGHVYDHGRTYGNIDVRGYETNAYLPYHTDAGDMVGLLWLRPGIEGGLRSIVSSTAVHTGIAAQHPGALGL